MKAHQSKLRYLFSEMPPLTHFQGKQQTGALDIQDSEVLQWISNNTEALYFLFDCAVNAGAIRFHPTTCKWFGFKPSIPHNGALAETFLPSKPGRPPRATVRDIVELLPETPIFLVEWAAKCCPKFGISRRTFSNLKVQAEKYGLIECIPAGTSLKCRRIPAKMPATNSATVVPLPERNAGSLATVANTEK